MDCCYACAGATFWHCFKCRRPACPRHSALMVEKRPPGEVVNVCAECQPAARWTFRYRNWGQPQGIMLWYTVDVARSSAMPEA